MLSVVGVGTRTLVYRPWRAGRAGAAAGRAAGACSSRAAASRPNPNRFRSLGLPVCSSTVLARTGRPGLARTVRERGAELRKYRRMATDVYGLSRVGWPTGANTRGRECNLPGSKCWLNWSKIWMVYSSPITWETLTQVIKTVGWIDTDILKTSTHVSLHSSKRFYQKCFHKTPMFPVHEDITAPWYIHVTRFAGDLFGRNKIGRGYSAQIRGDLNARNAFWMGGALNARNPTSYILYGAGGRIATWNKILPVKWAFLYKNSANEESLPGEVKSVQPSVTGWIVDRSLDMSVNNLWPG